MQGLLREVEEWCVDMGLSANPAKTEMVLFTRSRQKIGDDLLPIFFGEKLKCKDSVKYLGVILDRELSFKLHLQCVSASCYAPLVVIQRCMVRN